MKSILSILIIFFISNSVFAQNESTNINADTKDQETKAILNDSLEILSFFSKSNATKSKHITLNQFDNTYKKYLKLSSKDKRFNLNFNKVDHYSYSGTGEQSLILMKSSYKPNYPDLYYAPTFVEGMFSGLAQSFLLSLR